MSCFTPQMCYDNQVYYQLSRQTVVCVVWPKKSLIGAITPWEDGPITQLHTDLVIDTGDSQWCTTWPTRRLGHRLC